MIVSIASGKGGTGKTTLALNLAEVARGRVRLLDCDVEEPNDHLFFRGVVEGSEVVNMPVPGIDESLCDGCGECSAFCAYNALATIASTTIVFPEMCHGCGGCMRICPRGAITEVDHRIGTIEKVRSGEKELVYGRLDVGVPMAPPLIRKVKELRGDAPLTILDAPPGTSCPVISAIRGSDHVLLVTEPTPFGLNDLELAVEMTLELGIPFGVVVNRAGSGDDRVERFCRGRGIRITAEIPDDRRIAEAYSRGELAVNAVPGYREMFEGILDSIEASWRAPEERR